MSFTFFCFWTKCKIAMKPLFKKTKTLCMNRHQSVLPSLSNSIGLLLHVISCSPALFMFQYILLELYCIWISFSLLIFISVCFITIFHFADYPTSCHSKTVSPSPAFLDEEEFSDFMQGPVEVPTCGPSSTSQPFQSFHPTTPLGQLHAQKAGAQPLPPGQIPVFCLTWCPWADFLFLYCFSLVRCTESR